MFYEKVLERILGKGQVALSPIVISDKKLHLKHSYYYTAIVSPLVDNHSRKTTNQTHILMTSFLSKSTMNIYYLHFLQRFH